MGSATDEEVMDEIKLNILQEKRYYLSKYLVPDRYHAYLRSVFILSEDDQQIIENQATRRQKVGQLLDILQTKGGEAYEALIKAIRLDRTQTFIVEELHKEYEKRRNRYYDLANQTKVKELLIETNCRPKPVKPQKQSSEHQEDSPKSQRKSEQYSSISAVHDPDELPTYKKSPEPEKKTFNPTEVIFDRQHDERNCLGVKQKQKKVLSPPQKVALNSMIPLTVSDPEIRTMEISVADEKITVMGPPENRFILRDISSHSMVTPVGMPPQSLIRTPPHSLPTTSHSFTSDKVTKQQRNERQAAASKMFPRASSKSKDDDEEDDITLSSEPQGKSPSENDQGSAESLERDSMSNGQRDITLPSDNSGKACDQKDNYNTCTDCSSLLPTTLQDVSDDNSDEGETTALKQVIEDVRDISFVDSSDNVVSDEQSLETDESCSKDSCSKDSSSV